MKLHRLLAAISMTAAVLASTAVFPPNPVSAASTSWPAGQVRVIVPYPPATSGDLVMRKVAGFLNQKFGVSFYVDNRPGANGNIGMKDAKDAPADGYTFIAASDIQFAVSPLVYSHLPYDTDRDFTPVSPLAHNFNVIIANKNLKADNLRELVALGKAQPGKITYASTGIGSTHQLFMEMLKMQAGFDMVHVPYKGTGQATPDLVSGQVDVMFFGVPQALAQVAAGTLKVLAVGSPTRLKQLPDVPTIAESGFPGFVSDNFWGLWAPAGTPEAIILKLREAIKEALADPAIEEWYRASDLSTMDASVDELTKAVRAEREKWPGVIKAANIKLTE
jgi:tripartite-type tricarboxylate transporter receptor subunit TctC